MTLERIAYNQIESVLTQLGFNRSPGPRSHIAYRNQALNTRFFFPKHRAKDLVPLGTVIGIRKILVERGIVDAETLDEMLLAAAA